MHTHAHTQHSRPPPKQVPGDLTWEVPPPLEQDFGMTQADRDAAASSTQQQHQHLQQQPQQQPFAVLLGPDAAEATAQVLAQPPPPPPLPPRSPRHSATSAASEAAAAAAAAGGGGHAAPPPGILAALRGVFAWVAEQHLQRLAAQLLLSENVGDRAVWAPLATQLAVRAVTLVDPQQHLLAPTRGGLGYSMRDEALKPLEPGFRIKYPDPCERIKVRAHTCGA